MCLGLKFLGLGFIEDVFVCLGLKFLGLGFA